MVKRRFIICIGLIGIIVLMFTSLVVAESGQKSLSARSKNQRIIKGLEPIPPEGMNRIPSPWETQKEINKPTQIVELPEAYKAKREATVELGNSLSSIQRVEMARIFARHESGLKALIKETKAQMNAFLREAGRNFLEVTRDLACSVKAWKAGLDREMVALLNDDQIKLYESSQLVPTDPTDSEQLDAMHLKGLSEGMEEELEGIGPELSPTDCYNGYYYHFWQNYYEYYSYLYAYYGYYYTGDIYALYGYYYAFDAFFYSEYAYLYCYYAYYYADPIYAYYGYLYGYYAYDYGYYGYLYNYYAYYFTGNFYCYYAYLYGYYGYVYGYNGYIYAYYCYFY